MHLSHGERLRELLKIPTRVTQIGLMPVAYTCGVDFNPARRVPAEEFTYWNRWENRSREASQGERP
jgi:hypothetical protein